MNSHPNLDSPNEPNKKRFSLLLWVCVIAVMATIVWTSVFIWRSGIDNDSRQPAAQSIVRPQISQGTTVAELSRDGMSDRDLLLTRTDHQQEQAALFNPVASGEFEPVYYKEQAFPNEDPEVFELTKHARGTDVAVSPDDRFVAASVGMEVRIWDLTSYRLWKAFHENAARISAITFSPDGQTIAAAGWDRVIRIWNVHTGELVRNISNPHIDGKKDVCDLAFIDQGKTLIYSFAANPNRLQVVDLDSGERIREWKAPGLAWRPLISVSSDGKLVSAFSQGAASPLWVWDLTTLERVYETPFQPIRFARFAPDRGTLFISGGDGSSTIAVHFEQLTDGKPRVETFKGGTRCGAFTRDGRMIAINLGASGIQVLNVSDWGRIHQNPMEHLLRVDAVEFTSDGQRLVSIGGEGLVKIWETQTGNLIKRLE